MEPPNISKNESARKLKLKTPLDIVTPSVNFGPPNISESTRARKLKLKSELDMVKYSR